MREGRERERGGGEWKRREGEEERRWMRKRKEGKKGWREAEYCTSVLHEGYVSLLVSLISRVQR